MRRPGGGKVAITIQLNLLRVARHHLRQDDVYRQHEDWVHTQLARLCRSAAIPLLTYDAGTARENRSYPTRARRYLAKCREYGQAESVLYALSFSPHLVRRVAFNLMSIRGALASRKANS